MSVEQGRGVSPLVTVVLPCLDEVESVGRCIREALDALSAHGVAAEVVVVDNGSHDGSADAARAAGARVIEERIHGYGRALRSGIAAARGSVVVMADADWSYDLSLLPAMVDPVLRDETDLVIGSRLDGVTRATMPLLHRYLGTPTLSYLVRRAGNSILVGDSQSGYRAFRRDAIERLGLVSNGMEFASEMLIRAGQAGLRISEVHTGYRERVGQSKLNPMADGLRHARLIFLLAPQLLLVSPGVALFVAGLLLTVIGLISPGGLEVGSLRWQPVFFSTIALVLGLDLAMVGMVFANRSTLARDETRRRYRFVARPRFANRCVIGGSIALLCGLGVDFLLFLRSATGAPALGINLALASAAQSLLIVGGSLATLGFMLKALSFNRRGQ
jgi:hypothetical protein